jgi:hypothetical protein
MFDVEIIDRGGACNAYIDVPVIKLVTTRMNARTCL